MFKGIKWLRIGVMATALLMATVTAGSATDLAMYYPVAVGGPLTSVVDGIVDDLMK
mgnify:FL=1